MTTTVSGYTKVVDRSVVLGCPMPEGFGILPLNFENASTRTELLFTAEASTLRTLLRNHKLPVANFLGEGEKMRAAVNKSFDWSAMIFVSASLLSTDPNLVNLALGVIGNYLTDLFRGLPNKKIRLSVVVEKKKDRSCKTVTYEGDASGLDKLADIVRAAGDE